MQTDGAVEEARNSAEAPPRALPQPSTSTQHSTSDHPLVDTSHAPSGFTPSPPFTLILSPSPRRPPSTFLSPLLTSSDPHLDSQASDGVYIDAFSQVGVTGEEEGAEERSTTPRAVQGKGSS